MKVVTGSEDAIEARTTAEVVPVELVWPQVLLSQEILGVHSHFLHLRVSLRGDFLKFLDLLLESLNLTLILLPLLCPHLSSIHSKGVGLHALTHLMILHLLVLQLLLGVMQLLIGLPQWILAGGMLGIQDFHSIFQNWVFLLKFYLRLLLLVVGLHKLV